MESNSHVSVPLRTGKKMKKRKELDALVANSVTKRSCRPKRVTAGGGISSQDQLLSESTDDQEYWVAGATERPRTRIARKRVCGTLVRACSAILMFACLVATTTVLWLFIDVREQITALRSELDQVAASSQGVPDALQKFHTISKNLQQNQTVILGKIADLKLQMENLSRQVADMQSKLNKFQEKLGNAPEYVNIPQQISEVSGSLANLGSQIKDLTTTVTSLKDYKTKSESLTNVMQKNITDLRQSLFSVQNMSQVPVAVNNKSDAKIENILKITDVMKSNISSMNSTFSNKIQWIYEDQQKDRKTVDLLSEIGQNISARVTTLEGICNTCSSVEISMKANINDISKQLVSLTSKVQEISTQIPTLQSKYRQLSSNNTDLQNKVRNLIEISGSGNPSPVMATPPDASTTSEKDRLVTSPPPKLATAKTEWQSTSS